MIDRRHFRKASNYYLALASEALGPAFGLYARLAGAPGRIPPDQWRRGILLGAAHIGDLLYRSSSLGALQAGLPQCEWTYLAEPGPAEVLRTHPALTGVIESTLPRPGSAAFFALARRLRAGKFDAAICYGTGTYWPELLLAAHSGIPNRVAYTHKGFSGLVTHPMAFHGAQPYPAHFRDLVADLTGQTPDWPLRPLVVTQEADEAEAATVWETLNLLQDVPVVACFVTTRQPAGQWPRAAYGETLAQLCAEYRVQLLLCGAAGDAATLEELKSAYELNCPIVAGRLPLRALVVSLGRVAGVFSTDSGPRHLANAAGVPVCFMRNLWSPKIETGSYLETEHDLAPEAECVAAGDENRAFRSIHPAGVARSIATFLRLAPRVPGGG